MKLPWMATGSLGALLVAIPIFEVWLLVQVGSSWDCCRRCSSSLWKRSSAFS